MTPLQSGLLWASVQSSLLCLVIIVSSYCLRGRRPGEMTAAMVGGFAGCWCLLGLAFLPWVHWSWSLPSEDVHREPNRIALREFHPSVGLEAVPERVEYPSQVPDFPLAWRQEIRRWIGRNLERVEHSLVSTANPGSNHHQVMDWMCFAGLSMIGVGIGWWILCYFSVRRVIQQSQPIEDCRVWEIAAELSDQLAFKIPIAMKESPHVSMGGTIGFCQVYILLNPCWRDWSPMQLRVVLAHEIAHAARRDFLCVLLGSITQSAFFYHPLIHWMFRRMRIEQEFAADGVAANLIGNAKAYGRALAELALRQNAKQDHRLDSVLMASGHDLVRRISMLRQGRFLKKTRESRWMAIMALVLLGSIPLSGLRSIASPDPKAGTTLDDQPSQETSLEDEKSKAQKQLKEASKAFPPIEIKSRMVFRPGRTKELQIDPHLGSWIEYSTIVLLGLRPPETSTLIGTTTTQIAWTDVDRQGGSFSQSAEVSKAIGFEFGTLSKTPLMSLLQALGPACLIQDEFDGHQLVGIRTTQRDDAPTIWMVDDRSGFHVGSRDEIEGILRDPAGYTQAQALTPTWAEADEYSKVILGIYSDDVSNLSQEFRRFYQGSKHQSDLEKFSVDKFLDGISNISVIVSEETPNAVWLKLGYASEENASKASKIAQGWIQMLPLAMLASGIIMDESTPMLRSTVDGNCLSLQFAPRWLRKLAWLDFVHDSDDPSYWNSLSDTRFKRVSNGIQRVPASVPLMSKEGLVQSVDAGPYRGKRVRLRCHVADDAVKERYAGIMIAASGSDKNLLNFQSRSMDGSSDFVSLMNDDEPRANQMSEEHMVAIDMDIPVDAHTITFGYYGDAFKITNDIIIRSFELDAIHTLAGKPRLERLPCHSDIFSIATRDQFEPKPINLKLDYGSAPSTEPGRVAEAAEENSIR